MSQKSYDQSPTLYLIPTPIGNMDDITLRAIHILSMVDIIFSEDTRVTGQLLKHLNLQKPLVASHEYNEKENATKLLELLKEGKNVGLVSDRGTPVISDPGYELSLVAIQHGYNVVSLPGATAVIPALTSSGIAPSPFIFYGFLNSKESKRKQELEELKEFPYTIIFYEAPHRIVKTLENISQIFGNRKISISREISKKFEEVYRDYVDNLVSQLDGAKGEMVIVVEGNKEQKTFDDLSFKEHVNLFLVQGYSVKDSIKKVAKIRSVKTSLVYDAYHDIKK